MRAFGLPTSKKTNFLFSQQQLLAHAIRRKKIKLLSIIKSSSSLDYHCYYYHTNFNRNEDISIINSLQNTLQNTVESTLQNNPIDNTLQNTLQNKEELQQQSIHNFPNEKNLLFKQIKIILLKLHYMNQTLQFINLNKFINEFYRDFNWIRKFLKNNNLNFVNILLELSENNNLQNGLQNGLENNLQNSLQNDLENNLEKSLQKTLQNEDCNKEEEIYFVMDVENKLIKLKEKYLIKNNKIINLNLNNLNLLKNNKNNRIIVMNINDSNLFIDLFFNNTLQNSLQQNTQNLQKFICFDCEWNYYEKNSKIKIIQLNNGWLTLILYINNYNSLQNISSIINLFKNKNIYKFGYGIQQDVKYLNILFNYSLQNTLQNTVQQTLQKNTQNTLQNYCHSILEIDSKQYGLNNLLKFLTLQKRINSLLILKFNSYKDHLWELKNLNIFTEKGKEKLEYAASDVICGFYHFHSSFFILMEFNNLFKKLFIKSEFTKIDKNMSTEENKELNNNKEIINNKELEINKEMLEDKEEEEDIELHYLKNSIEWIKENKISKDFIENLLNNFVNHNFVNNNNNEQEKEIKICDNLLKEYNFKEFETSYGIPIFIHCDLEKIWKSCK
ncbi:hypothetical protein ABK040_006150 [Willaertia magna]